MKKFWSSTPTILVLILSASMMSCVLDTEEADLSNAGNQSLVESSALRPPPPCECHSVGRICEVAFDCSEIPCSCDLDCQSRGAQPCSDDGHCDPRCPTDVDPDCIGLRINGMYCENCDCDFVDDVCEPAIKCSESECSCDPDCDSSSPCETDGFCDSWCPTDVDPDCIGLQDNGKYCEDCGCDNVDGICEAMGECSESECSCDPNCDGSSACNSDGFCDSRCPTDVDPDCIGDPNNGLYCEVCDCDFVDGICEPAIRCSESECPCDPDCDGSSACEIDGFCDSWCPTYVDMDCYGHPDNGKYC